MYEAALRDGPAVQAAVRDAPTVPTAGSEFSSDAIGDGPSTAEEIKQRCRDAEGSNDVRIEYLTQDKASWYVLWRKGAGHTKAAEFDAVWKTHPEEFRQFNKPGGGSVPLPRWDISYGPDYAFSGGKPPSGGGLERLAQQPLLKRTYDLSRDICQGDGDPELNGVLL